MFAVLFYFLLITNSLGWHWLKLCAPRKPTNGNQPLIISFNLLFLENFLCSSTLKRFLCRKFGFMLIFPLFTQFNAISKVFVTIW